MKFYCGILGIILIVTVSIVCPTSWAFESFHLREIKVEGLQRIQYGTVLTYLPVEVGQSVDTGKVQTLIRALYQTGFFDSVNIFQSGQMLIVRVKEKPTIAGIVFVGNQMISTEQMTSVFQKYDLIEGQVFNEAIFTQIRNELEKQYALQGHYHTRITVDKKYLRDNRVKLTIQIHEGKVARVASIQFQGNRAFSAWRLRSILLLKTSHWWTHLLSNDHFTREILEGSLEALRSFYMDRGYINMQLSEPQLHFDTHKKYVAVTLHINEGNAFHFGAVKLVGVLPEQLASLKAVVTFKAGERFSRQRLNEAVEALNDRLGDWGYLPTIEARPVIDPKKHQVAIHFVVHMGQPVYVKRIEFSGNDKTADYVLRHAIRQHEAERFSIRAVRESERQLRLLEFFEQIETKTRPVAGTDNQVDLLFKVKERPAAKASLSGGYGGHSGFQLSAAVNQPNFMGSGRSVGINFNANNFGKHYAINYFDPYYYSNRVGRGFNFSYDRSKLGRRNDIESYRINNFKLGYYTVVSITDSSSVRFGVSAEHLTLPTYRHSTVSQYRDFYLHHGDVFNAVKLNTRWIYNSYDRYPFPTEGWHHSLELSAAVPPNSRGLAYYKVHFQGQGYRHLPKAFVLTGGMVLGYGNAFGQDDYPIYENFMVGGLGFSGQVRGYNTGTLGPKGTVNAKVANAIGGNALCSVNTGVVLPYPMSQANVRTTAFIDAGNVYTHKQAAFISGEDPGPIRFSSGLSFNWRSPLGPMLISVAKPLNKQANDTARLVDFTISTGF